MRKIILLLMTLCTTQAYALRQPFFDLFAQHVQRVDFAMKKPTFTGELQHYDKLYRGTSWYAGISAAAYLPVYTKMFAVGLGFGLDWYQDGGVAALIKGETIVRAEEEETQLTLVPARVLLVTAFKPLGEWVSLDLGIGLEYLYGQETRVSSGNDKDGEAQEDTAPLLNKGWQPYRVAQAGINISLHRLEKRAMHALHHSFGISNVYLSLKVEQVQIMRKRGTDFSRRSLAFGLMFEAS